MPVAGMEVIDRFVSEVRKRKRKPRKAYVWVLASLLLLLPAVDCLTALALLSHLVAFVRSQAFAALAEQLKLVPGGLQVSPVLTEHMELFPSAEVEDGAGFELPRDRPRLQDTDAPIFFFKHLKVCVCVWSVQSSPSALTLRLRLRLDPTGRQPAECCGQAE